MLKLYTADNPIEAHLLRGFLEAHGIEALVQGDHLFGGRGEIPLTFDTLPTVWAVRPSEHARAQSLLAEWQERPRLADWACRACGEHIDGEFESCWQCGAMRLSV